jgi:hypothetical protein
MTLEAPRLTWCNTLLVNGKEMGSDAIKPQRRRSPPCHGVFEINSGITLSGHEMTKTQVTANLH